MVITEVEIEPLRSKHYETILYVVANGYGFSISISGYYPKPSLREIEGGWEPDEGMDHVESEVHYGLATLIANALSKKVDTW